MTQLWHGVISSKDQPGNHLTDQYSLTCSVTVPGNYCGFENEEVVFACILPYADVRKRERGGSGSHGKERRAAERGWLCDHGCR